MAAQPSNWQQLITGDWHGMPALFKPDGSQVAFNRVSRSSVFENGRTTYYMHTNFDGADVFTSRFQIPEFAFGVVDSDKDRIYTGPDFYGTGRPFGPLVHSEYFSPGWNVQLRTINHIVADRGLQVYSSQLFEGNCLVAVFNGLYINTRDKGPEVDARIEAHLAAERVSAKRPFVLPVKHRGQWRGEMAVYNADQEYVGSNEVVIDHTPQDLLRAKMDVTISGVVNRKFSYLRSRESNHHQFHGPDLIGNGMSFGRYCYSRAHVFGKAEHIDSRETLIDNNFSLCCYWQFMKSQKEQYNTFGVLDWHGGEDVLKPNYV
ncbi:MAG TPA: hypothetical protein VGE51_10310 [Fontimonas sp.]